jgi:ABC-2 type transport system ATP-binding protein
METEILSIKNLSKTYKSNSIAQPVLKDIDINFYKNQTVGLLGKNGVGKTTFIKSCLDLVKYNGSISYFGKSLNRMTRTEKVECYSAVLEGSRNIYWKLTAIENLKYFSALRGVKYSSIREYAEYLLNYLLLYEKRNHLVENFSTGMKQKLSLICAFAMNTPVIFLDEPTLGLDLESKNHVIDFLINTDLQKDKLIIISSHDLNLINRVSSNIMLLKDGNLKQYSSIESNTNTFDFTILQKSDVQQLLKLLNYQELYQNGFFTTYRINGENKNLSELICIFEKNKIEIKSIESTKYNLENFYLS